MRRYAVRTVRPRLAPRTYSTFGRRGKLPCASGTHGAQEAAARSPYVQVQVRRPQGVRVSAVAHRRYVEVPGVWEGGQVGDLQLGCGAEGVEGAARAAALRAAAEEVGRAGGWWLRRRWRWQERRELPGIALSLGAGEALGLVGERVRTRTRGAGRGGQPGAHHAADDQASGLRGQKGTPMSAT